MPVRGGSPLMFAQGLNPIWPVDFLAFRTLRMKNRLFEMMPILLTFKAV
jgi:hypothetical protein